MPREKKTEKLLKYGLFIKSKESLITIPRDIM